MLGLISQHALRRLKEKHKGKIMEVILLERIRGLGKIGDIVNVKPGFARNYLVPQQKASLATKANIAAFELRRQELEAKDKALLADAEALAAKVAKMVVTIEARVHEDDRLYGSITARDIVHALKEQGFELDMHMIDMPNGPLRELGTHDVKVLCHMDVEAMLPVTIKAIEETAH